MSKQELLNMLLTAAKRGKVEDIKEMRNDGLSLENNREARLALLLAAHSGKLETVKNLVLAGVDADTRTRVFVDSSNKIITKKLDKSEQSRYYVRTLTPLSTAVEKGRLEVVKFLFEEAEAKNLSGCPGSDWEGKYTLGVN